MPSSQKDQLSPSDNREGEAKEVISNRELAETARLNFESFITMLRNDKREEAEKALTKAFETLEQIK